MATMIIITFLTAVILIIAIICYKEYMLRNNDTLKEIQSELRQLGSKLEINNRILVNLADSISFLPKESKNKKKNL